MISWMVMHMFLWYKKAGGKLTGKNRVFLVIIHHLQMQGTKLGISMTQVIQA